MIGIGIDVACRAEPEVMELLGAGSHAKLGVGKDIGELAGKEGGMKAEPMMAMKQPDKDVLQQLDSDVRLPPSNGPMMGFPPGPGQYLSLEVCLLTTRALLACFMFVYT